MKHQDKNTCNIRLKQLKYFKHTRIAIATYATPDLLLQHSNKTYTTYIWKRIKHKVATCAHILAIPTMKARWCSTGEHSARRGRPRRKARAGCATRGGSGVRQEVQDGSGCEAQGRAALGESILAAVSELEREASRFFWEAMRGVGPMRPGP
jgi:hypothetical protein